MRVLKAILSIAGLVVVVGCLLLIFARTFAAECSMFTDWEDDHLILNELELLEANDLWVQVRNTPAEPLDCTFVLCQNVLRGASYEVIGDVDEAKMAALAELTEIWAPTSDLDPFGEESIQFQLRNDVEIGTTTGTAFLWVSFVEDMQVRSDAFVANAIGLTVTSSTCS